MNKRLQIRKDEPLYEWCKRIADELQMTAEQREALSEVSKQSYIKGVNTECELSKKYEH
jgi:hypothetical protein